MTRKLVIAKIRHASGIFSYNNRIQILFPPRSIILSTKGIASIRVVPSRSSPHGIWLKSGKKGGRLL